MHNLFFRKKIGQIFFTVPLNKIKQAWNQLDWVLEGQEVSSSCKFAVTILFVLYYYGLLSKLSYFFLSDTFINNKNFIQ